VRRRGFVSEMYRAARLANDVSTLASGNPSRIARRARNKIVGRALGRAGLWRALWR
jgi:hypothetical protein